MELSIAIIGVPGAWSSEHLKHALESVESATVTAEIIPVESLVFSVQDNLAYYQSKALTEFDAVVIKKLGAYRPKILDWLDVLSNMEDKGLPFFSSPKKLRRMISRVGCTLGLSAHEVTMPNTFITESVSEAIEWIEEKKTVVFKPNFSTKAKGMEVIDFTDVSDEWLTNLKKQFGVLYLQEKMELPGKDLGVVFLGEEYLGTYARVGSKESWNTTTRDGGYYESHEPNEEILALARKARAVFDLDFCCVDVAETPSGYVVFEVSAFGGFSGLYKGAGIDTAAQLSEQIIQRLKQ